MTDIDLSGRIIDAALELAATRGWADTGLADIAATAGVSLAELHDRFRSKTEILLELMQRVDQQVLAATPPLPGTAAGAEGIAGPGQTEPDAGRTGGVSETPRDRLFDLLMRRFDALKPYRAGLARVVRDRPREPAALAVLGTRLGWSIAWVQVAAGLSPDGWRGKLRTVALEAIYLDTFKVWLDDDSADLARTMAALDNRLRQAEQFATVCSAGPLSRCFAPRRASVAAGF